MSNIMKKSEFTNVKNNMPLIKATAIMGIFTYVFLCCEYLFVNVLSLFTSADNTVSAQNCALGISAVGIMLYPVFNRFCKKQLGKICCAVTCVICVICIVLVCMHISYGVTLWMGFLLFLFLGIILNAVFYTCSSLIKDDKYLARIVGASYMCGVLIQLFSNNIISSGIVQAVVLSLLLSLLVWLLAKVKNVESNAVLTYKRVREKADNKSKAVKSCAVYLALLIVLMTCIFSTLDNAVTLIHAKGDMDIGQMPRILLAVSGLVAGFVFDINARKDMGIIMYCVMLLSTICMAVIELSGSYMIGLIIFYVCAGFFAVFFTTGFMEISRYLKTPQLWAGFGRALNNITAAVISGVSMALLSSDNGIAVITVAVILFASVSVVTAVYTFKRKVLSENSDVEACESLDNKERLKKIAEKYSFTPREAEAFGLLVDTVDSIQVIADSMYISKRTLERYISSIYEKTGAKSRVELIKIFNNR